MRQLGEEAYFYRMTLTLNALPLSAMVKDSTKTLHEEVEQLLLPRLMEIRDRDDYAVVLKMFYGFFYPLETKLPLYISETDLLDFSERRKTSSVLLDLQAIDHSIEHLSLCSSLPQIQSKAQAFGVLYVLEGSTLGGKMIAKMLRKNNASAVPDDALHFFSGYGEDTGNKWKTFLQALNNQAQPADVITAANETFLHLKHWMQHTLYHV